MRVLMWSGLTLWCGAAELWFQFDGTRPMMADALAGRKYALNTRGHVVYLTLHEAVLLYRMMAAGFAGVMVATASANRRYAPGAGFRLRGNY